MKFILVEIREKQWLHTPDEYVDIMTSYKRYGGSHKAEKVDFEWDDKYRRTLDIGYPFEHEKAGKTRTLKEWVDKCKDWRLDKGREDSVIAASIVAKSNRESGWIKIKE